MNSADLIRQFRINHGALHQNLAGLTHEDSVVQPEAGNCLNWVVGHLVSSRNGILTAMGREPYWPAEQAARYARGSAPVKGTADARPFEGLVSDFDQTQERILAGLAELTDADLQKPHQRDMTVGEWISFLHFHEAYHIGQTGILRRLPGKEGAIR
jgi:uncharacterized damage-inducible protein DinB